MVVGSGEHAVLINFSLKFIHSEKATKFCKIFTLLFSYVAPVKGKVKISQNFVAFSEYMNFTYVSDGFGFFNHRPVLMYFKLNESSYM